MRPQELQQVLASFKEGIVTGRSYVNNEFTPVQIKYDGTTVTFANLDDLPSYLRITRRETGVYVEVSDTGVNDWERIESQAEAELQIYSLFDPSVVLPYALLGETRIRGRFVEGACPISELPLPNSVKQFLFDGGDKWRWVRAQFRKVRNGRRLVSITQKDFPPFQDFVTILFE